LLFESKSFGALLKPRISLQAKVVEKGVYEIIS